MKAFFGLFFMFCVGNMFSQDLTNLDNKYGFNKFKFESSASLHKSFLQLEFDEEKVKYYSYLGSDIETLFDYKVGKITLGYYKDKLYYIGIIFKDDESIYKYKEVVYNKLKTLFGSGVYSPNVKNGPFEYNWVYRWSSPKVYLSFDQKSNGETAIWLTSKVVEEKMLNDEF